ncbi:MAG: hypothetical protein QM796_06840 [Chthoniobacteraceae bacterium]
MPKVLLIVSIILMGGSAVLGFLTKTKMDGFKTQLASQSDQLKSEESQVAKAKNDLKAKTDELATAKAAQEQGQGDVQAAKDAQTKAESALADANKQIDELKVKLQTPTPGATPADIGASADDLAKLQQQVTDLKTQLTEATTVRDSLQGANQKLQAQIQPLQDYHDRHERVMAASNLEGQVLAYNQAWNFVVLSIGDHQGVVANAELIIKRGGTKIATVRVSSVNPNTAVADIVAGSVSSGVTVQPGDEVVYQGS